MHEQTELNQAIYGNLVFMSRHYLLDNICQTASGRDF